MATKKSSIVTPTSEPGVKRRAASKAALSKKPASRAKKKAGTGKPGAIASLSVDPKPVVKEPELSHEAISLRAYYIAERRRKLGWHGDAHSDWLEAVSQLRAEALEKPLRKR